MYRGPLPVPVPDPPKGYALRTAVPDDAGAYADLFAAAYPEFGPRDLFGELYAKSLPEGFFAVVAADTGMMVASAAAALFPIDRYPEGASLQWLMVHPLHRGMGLGMLVSAAATDRLVEAGFPCSYLLTQDPRHAGISIYFRLGWRPSLYQADMHDRWRAVCRHIGRGFSPDEWQLPGA